MMNQKQNNEFNCLEDLLDISDKKEVISTTSPNKPRIESPHSNLLNIVSTSPHRVEKPSFFNNQYPLNKKKIPNVISQDKQAKEAPQLRSIKTEVIKSPKLQSNAIDPNLNRNLNNIFSAFGGSSLLSGSTYEYKGAGMISNDKTNILYKQPDSSPTSGVKKKNDLISAVSNHFQMKERKESPFKFNALFNLGENLNKKKEETVQVTSSAVAMTNSVPIITASPRIININSTSASLVQQPISFYSVKEFSYKEDKNLRFRNSMEDYGKIVDMFMGDKSKGFFSIYDGHGGVDTVKYTKDRMPDILSKAIEKNPTDIEQNIINSFMKLDDELKYYDSENTGSTACVVYICLEQTDRVIYCANVGDTKCFLISTSEVKQLSIDHKCTDNSEVERIKAAGGLVFSGRVFGQLVLTRALGDHALKKYGVIATPHVKRVVIEDNHRYIVLATDGIWDVITEQNLYEMSESSTSAEDLAKNLIKNAVNGGSKDNMSCIVIKLN